MEKPPVLAPPYSKDDIRSYAKAVRDAMSADELLRASRAVASRLIELPAFITATTFLSYAPFRGEISPEPALALRAQLMDDAPRIAYPRVTGAHEMEARFCAAEQLEEGAFGIPEPSTKAVFLDPADIDVVLVPGLAFDRRGFRVGYGKGFYDAYLSRLGRRTTTIGLCFDETLLDVIPLELLDRDVDYVVTPAQVI